MRLALQRRQLLLSAAFVFVCAFRSFLPRIDVSRVALVPSWLSTVLVGRTLATVAELAFVLQWALLLHAIAKRTHHELVHRLGHLGSPSPLAARASSCQ